MLDKILIEPYVDPHLIYKIFLKLHSQCNFHPYSVLSSRTGGPLFKHSSIFYATFKHPWWHLQESHSKEISTFRLPKFSQAWKTSHYEIVILLLTQASGIIAQCARNIRGPRSFAGDNIPMGTWPRRKPTSAHTRYHGYLTHTLGIPHHGSIFSAVVPFTAAARRPRRATESRQTVPGSFYFALLRRFIKIVAPRLISECVWCDWQCGN